MSSTTGHPVHTGRRRGVAGLVALAAVTAVLGGGQPAAATEDTDPVVRWAGRAAVPIRDLDRPGPDLARLRHATREARIVGLGEAAHKLTEVTALKRRAVEYLIEERGFRSLAWEDDWTLGIQINDYIHGRRDDRDALVAQMSRSWRTREVADLLTWLRGYNSTHDNRVRFVGVEYFTTRPLAYDAVEAYVAQQAPHRLAEVRELLEPIKPAGDDMRAHLDWYMNVDQEPYLRSARRLHRLVAGIGHRPGDRGYAVAVHHAKQIRSWYTAFSLPREEVYAYRDARAAENLRWWQRFSGDKVIYWAAAAHTADAPDLAITAPSAPDVRFAGVGSYLDDWYRDRYVTIGYTFDRGSMDATPGNPIDLPPAADDWFEAPLGGVDHSQFLLAPGKNVPARVRDWLNASMVTRGDPSLGPSSTMTGSTPADWFDLIVHRQEVSPATPLP
ncbi:MAG: erythromycin esterase family protein [Streptomyces sp.]|uniref:erythromycin esterase family protein n=1 Tax=Streptomyces sp. TaxID=1931 RepID=UPI003D6B9351